MNKQTQNILILAAVGLGAYWLIRGKKVTTSSSASDKMQLTCAQGEKLVEEPTGMRCVPVSEVVSGPTPSVNLSADGSVICPVCGRELQTVDGQIVRPPFGGCGCGQMNRFSNPNISGVPTNIVTNFASMAGVNIKANDFFTQKPGGFYK